MNNDSLSITFMEDGTIKAETNQVSQANHAVAENFFKILAQLMGGEVSRVNRGSGHQHTHDHVHEGEKQ
jgi:hypothetical protein